MPSLNLKAPDPEGLTKPESETGTWASPRSIRTAACDSGADAPRTDGMVWGFAISGECQTCSPRPRSRLDSFLQM